MRLSILLAVMLLMIGCQSSEQEPGGMSLEEALGGSATAGFKQAIAPRAFSFPKDHQAHLGFRNEWWYVTGNVEDTKGHHYGFQVTFFRIGLTPEQKKAVSVWHAESVWMAHVALTDVSARQHFQDHRLVREAAGLAGQSNEPFKVWMEDWQILGSADGDFPWAIDVKTNDFSLQLNLKPLKPVVLQGDKGLSQKGKGLGNASFYYSFPRLSVTGSVSIDGEARRVSGLGWLDREWSTSVLDEEQVGWDWFSLQLTDGRDLMFYRLRNKDGSSSSHSAGSVSNGDGGVTSLALTDVELQPLVFWESEDGQRYPVKWRVDVQRQGSFVVEALLEDQAMDGAIRYWEGAVRVSDHNSNQPLGHGYLEMTGY